MPRLRKRRCYKVPAAISTIEDNIDHNAFIQQDNPLLQQMAETVHALLSTIEGGVVPPSVEEILAVYQSQVSEDDPRYSSLSVNMRKVYALLNSDKLNEFDKKAIAQSISEVLVTTCPGGFQTRFKKIVDAQAIMQDATNINIDNMLYQMRTNIVDTLAHQNFDDFEDSRFEPHVLNRFFQLASKQYGFVPPNDPAPSYVKDSAIKKKLTTAFDTQYTFDLASILRTPY